jgi:CDP-ribitol ribitolphosphotransferase / teichoic acid ribitol-phosphate polymerase
MTCRITAISWERVHLSLLTTFAGQGDVAGNVQFMIVDGDRVYPVQTTPVGNGQYRLDINVTNFRDRRQVPDGTWRFVAYIDGKPGPAAGYDLSALGELDESSRSFLYSANKASYIINFAISEDADNPDLIMRAYQMYRRPKPPKASLKRRIKQRVLPRSRRVRLANAVYRLARLAKPSKGNRILFASEMRTAMEGNLERVHERMAERGLASKYDIRHSFRIPRIATKQTTLRTIYLLATSDIVLIDDYFGLLETLNLAPETKIIQLWHAGSGFKAVGYSRFGVYGSPRLQNAHRKYTYTIAGSTHLVPVYAEAFGIEESAVIPTGLPRIDTFLDTARTEKVVSDFYKEYPHLVGKKIILFAPTFRGRGIQDAHYDYSQIDFARLHEMCGDDAVVLFRMHHFIRKPVPIPAKYADRLIDFAKFPSTNDLLHMTDVMITDYSSVIYEYSLLDKPMLFYAYDKEVYSATRGFHRDYDSMAPGKVCETFDELVKALQTEDYDTEKVEAFRRENFDRIDTGSADRVIDWLILSDPRTSTAMRHEDDLDDPDIADQTLHDDPSLSDQSEW